MHTDADLTHARSGDPGQTPLDKAHAASVEVVRTALVRLRGGAPFLSSSDGALLVQWLDDGVPVWRILQGLETAARQRHARRVRAPLGLGHAARHLGRPRSHDLPPELVARPTDDHPLAPIAAALRAAVPPAGLETHTAHLGAVLRGLPAAPRDALADAAATAILAFLDEGWRLLGQRDRAAFIRQATVRLEDILSQLDEARAEALVEEHARGLWRAAWPALSLTVLWRLVD